MSGRYVWIDRPLPAVADSEEEAAWLRWCSLYGIDTRYVVVPSLLWCDDTNRRISWTELARDDDGRVRLVYGLDGSPGVEPHHRTLQLEAPALPFPPGPYPVHTAADGPETA